MRRTAIITVSLVLMGVPALRADVQQPIDQRFAQTGSKEVPQLRRHVVPLFAVLGCNKAGCHGSFEGRGGFRLSLFGYDPKMDYTNLIDREEPRIDLEFPTDSLILEKPTLKLPHGGGKRLKTDSWQYRVLLRWIQGGAKPAPDIDAKLTRLDVTPREIVFTKKGDVRQLRVVAHWSDGTTEDVTPLCRYRVNSTQIATISTGGTVTAAEGGDSSVVVFYDAAVVAVPVMRPVSDLIGERYPAVPTPTRIDELVVSKLRKLGIVPSGLSTDSEFLRRVSLDMTGSLPTPQEVTAFLADESPGKRSRKIDELLESPAYAAWWTTRLCDITGNNTDALGGNVTPVPGQASQEWYDWIYQRVKNNTPYDDLVAGIVLGISREPGESFSQYSKNMSDLARAKGNHRFADRSTMPYYWARRTFRKPSDRAVGFAYTFLGIHIQCAQCHKHPFDRWTQDDLRQFTGFFSNTEVGQNPESKKQYAVMLADLGLKGAKGGKFRRLIPRLLREGKTVPFQEVYSVRPRPKKKANPDKKRRKRKGKGKRSGRYASQAKLLGGETVDLTQFADSRRPLMDWLRSEGKEPFARAFVNRVWAAYFNRGIVEPPDDLSLANPPCNKPLLDYLTLGFIEHRYDMKWLHREIVSSRTYQSSWKPNNTNRLDARNFSHAIPRRLPAEVIYDALLQATASDSAIDTMHRDMAGRAIAIPSTGRRNRGNSGSAFALSVFGRSTRTKNCDCDRSSDPSLLQTIFLQNDQDMLAMIDRRKGSWLAEVATRMGVRYKATIVAAKTGRTHKKPADYARMVKSLKSQLAAIRKKGNKKAIDKAERRLARYQKRYGSKSRTKKKPIPKAGKQPRTQVARISLTQIVRQSYLRTLSRYPTKEELARARKYISDSDDTINGVRGLMWVLVNTKEFIVNH